MWNVGMCTDLANQTGPAPSRTPSAPASRTWRPSRRWENVHEVRPRPVQRRDSLCAAAASEDRTPSPAVKDLEAEI